MLKKADASSTSSSSSTSSNQSPQLENGPTSSTGTQENGDQTGKLSKRLSKSKAPISSSTSTAKVIEFIDGNEVASTSANEATSSSSHSEAKAADPAVSLPGCSRSLNSSRTGAPESNRSTSNSHHSSNSVLASVDSHLSISSDDDSNSDELGGLEANKCNIADDSDDSASHKSISSRFSTSKMHLDPSLTTSQNFKQLASSQPVNQALTSPQSNAVNSSDVQLNNSSSGKSPSNSVKSIRNGGNAVPLRNTCHVHRSSISSNDLMMSSSSSNYVPSHRLLHSSSYNASPSHCCHFRHHHHSHRVDSMIPVSSLRQQQQQQCQLANHKNPFDLGMSSIEATSIISSHCNTENNNSNAPNSAAITKLTSSSFSGLPVATLTVMQSPNLSSSRHGTYNWQAFMSTLKDRMATIFNCELLADVHFIVGKGNTQTRFPAHKFVLSIGSAVFDAMFNGPLTKAALTVESHKHSELRSTGDDTEIELPDIEPEAFQALLRFLYLDEVQIGPETVMTTLYAAKKYEVPALEMACVDFLKANLNPDNAFMMLTQARLFDENTLADLCLETIDKHTMDSLFSDSFFDIDLDTLKLVLDRDSLRVREVSLFLAAMRWAEFECTRRSLELNSENKRKVLGDALYLIRFPLMSIEEFAHNVAQSELLTDKEVVNLFLYFTVSSKPTVPFPIEPRCCITGEECSVNRFQRTESRWGYSGTSDRIRFLTDRPIFVIGFGLFGSIHGGSEYEAIIEVIHTGSGKVLASNTTSFVSDGSDSTFRVMFKYPVEITQNTNYTACATLKGVDSYYGTNGYRTVTVNLGKGDSKESVTFQFSYAAGCNNGTSVEDGQIPQILFYT